MQKDFLSCKAEIVSRLRTLFEGTVLEHESFFEDGPIRCRPRDVRLPGETDVDAIVFPTFRNQGANSLAWGTSDEEAFSAIAPRIASALEDLPVNVDVASRLLWTLVGGEMVQTGVLQFLFSIQKPSLRD